MNKKTFEILHDQKGHKGEFYIIVNGEKTGVMSYSMAGEKRVIIDHTEVGETLRGTGAGKQLVAAGVGWARKQGLKVIPLCPFAKAIIGRTPEFQDVV